jgi:hypothetical protein
MAIRLGTRAIASGLRSRHEPGEGIDLIIHHQQCGASWIDARKLRHGFLLPDKEFSYDVPLFSEA